MKYEKEFREAHPETIGETDKQFDQSNYVEWLELYVENKLILSLRMYDEERIGRERMRKLYAEKLSEIKELKKQLH